MEDGTGPQPGEHRGLRLRPAAGGAVRCYPPAMHAPDKFTGHRLSDLLALGRDTVEIVCPACGGKPKTAAIRDLIGRFGNPVLPAVPALLTPTCPRRGRPEGLSCWAVFTHPLTVEEEARIKAWRVG